MDVSAGPLQPATPQLLIPEGSTPPLGAALTPVEAARVYYEIRLGNGRSLFMLITEMWVPRE